MFKRFVFFAVLYFAVVSGLAISKESDSNNLFIVHFELGPNWDKSLPPQEQTSFREHSLNLRQLRQEKMIVFGARYSDLGVIILKSETLANANAIISNDPGVASGIFTFKIEPLNVFYEWEK